MSLLEEILAWSVSDLEGWKRDALRRLFQKIALDQKDKDDLYAMLKSAHGITDSESRIPTPLAPEHLPPSKPDETLTLLALRDLKYVNRIAQGQKLEFAPKGITIVYGGNGSGKSGYARVLKKACRARDASENVHSDVTDSNASSKIPEAVFDVEQNGRKNSLIWKRDKAPPQELARVQLFDAYCARSYLDEKGNAAFRPYYLDIVENLGRVLTELGLRLNSEIQSLNTDKSAFDDLLGSTAVGNLIASLSNSTTQQQITVLATLSDTEKARLVELNKALAEIDPKTRIKELRLSIQRVGGVVNRINAAAEKLADTVVVKLKTLDDETEVALNAEKVAAEGFRSGEILLAGTGEQVWKALFNAARSFSEIAYPEEPFPNISDAAQCLLCQQPITPEAAGRMQRFESFVKKDVSKLAVQKRDERQDVVGSITETSVDFGLDEAIVQELQHLDAPLLESIKEFEIKVGLRKASLLDALISHDWNSILSLDGDPTSQLKALSEKISVQVSDLEKLSDEEQRKVFEKECAELQSRANLFQRVKSLVGLTDNLRIKTSLEACKTAVNPRRITDKAKELTTKAVTDELRKALNEEFAALGAAHIKTKLVEYPGKGGVSHQLILDLPSSKELREILSEGEQRIIAIGSFLAELALAGHKGAIVFDDPVSSLDHHRRKYVARRFLEEAKKRQVIVLTHDTVFLGELLELANPSGIEHIVQYLEWQGKNAGHVLQGLPWEHQGYKERIDNLEKTQRLLATNWPPYPTEEDRSKMRREYSLLRATIERIIQDLVFNGVVRRYRDWIKVDKLKGAGELTDPELQEIIRIHKTCCDTVDAHDPASGKDETVPSPHELATDITSLKGIAVAISARRSR